MSLKLREYELKDSFDGAFEQILNHLYDTHYKSKNEAIKVSKNLSSAWLDMSYDQKYELQQFVFPKGVTYNKENDRVRTPDAFVI